jgi:hypothetical protein
MQEMELRAPGTSALPYSGWHRLQVAHQPQVLPRVEIRALLTPTFALYCEKSATLAPPAAMQHEHYAPGAPSPLDLSEVLRALWASLGADGRRALRECGAITRDAVDAHTSGLDGWTTESLSPATCARLSGVLKKHCARWRACAACCCLAPSSLA